MLSFRTLRGFPVKGRNRRAVNLKGWSIDPSAPYDVARTFLVATYYCGGCPTLHHHKGGFYAWDGRAFIETGKDTVRAKLYNFLDQCKAVTENGEKVKPDTALVNKVLDAVTARVQLDNAITAPAWLEGGDDFPADEIFACSNGLLHLQAQKLLTHTPAFYTHNAVKFPYEPDAPEPSNWLKFIGGLWPDDLEAVAALQEIFGYCLTGDTSQQKAFLLIGPPRSGKGTIGRVLRELVGKENAAGPNLTDLCSNFGIAPLIGKQVAIIPDARLGARANQQAIAERLLSITGEDAITVDRKYLSAWTGRLQVRFLIISNELPRIADASGALASRFVTLATRNSFLGREDSGLINKLIPELPGILNWAIEGWRRLKERGHFAAPASSADYVREFEDLGSPIGAFVRDRCAVGAGRAVETAMLFAVWCDWCKKQNRHPGSAEQFGKDLRAAVPGINVTQPRAGSSRVRRYEGIGLTANEPT